MITGPNTNIGYDSEIIGFVMDVDYDGNNPDHKDLDASVPYGLNLVFNTPVALANSANSIEWFSSKQKRNNFRAVIEDAKS